MAAGKQKYRILVAAAGDKISAVISGLLPKSDYEIVRTCDSAGVARRAMLEVEADIVIINAPLRDEFGTQFALDLADRNCGVLMLVAGDVYDAVSFKLEEEGILVLAKPLSKDMFHTAVKLLSAMQKKLRRMDKEKRALQEKMQDLRLVNQAKWLLVEHLHMSENDAHYFIEKQAMDSRKSCREMAQSIINSYQ